MPKDFVHHYHSPLVGWLELRASDDGIHSVDFVGKPSRPTNGTSHPLLAKLVAELDKYFAGGLTKFTVPVTPKGGTPFQRRVWSELLRIPYGQTASYGEIAERIGKPRASRAVGSANGANCVPILIPCHRVVRSGGGLGGFGSGTHIKKRLLELEGAKGKWS
ncbi:MAG: methylated-DNA--[protein]-cysteine S-methyltransferase [Thermodesulfobacteriota bacterium]